MSQQSSTNSGQPDNRGSAPGIALLLISAALLSAVISSSLVLLSMAGWKLPAVFSFVLGLIVGSPFGVCLQRTINLDGDNG